MERKKIFSLVSTILMTIYTALIAILNIGMFAIAASFWQLPGAMPYAVSVVMFVAAFVLLILTITLIVATVLSYKFIGDGKFKNDAWMKIAIFGISFLGFVCTMNSIGLMAFCGGAVFLTLPIGLSVVVLCDDSESNDSKNKKEKESTKESEGNS